MGRTNHATRAKPPAVRAARSGTPAARASHNRARGETDDAEQPTSFAALLRRWLRKVPDRGHDVHPAHPPRGKRHHDEREQHPDRVGDDDALRLYRVGHVKVARGCERPRHEQDHQVGDRHAEERADGRGENVVCDALEEEHLHQVAPPCSDRACDSEFPAAFAGEHDEDEEDEKDAGRDRERAEGREERHEAIAGGVGSLERILLRRIGLEPERRERRLEHVRDLVG
jgi:hypothetical protein